MDSAGNGTARTGAIVNLTHFRQVRLTQQNELRRRLQLRVGRYTLVQHLKHAQLAGDHPVGRQLRRSMKKNSCGFGAELCQCFISQRVGRAAGFRERAMHAHVSRKATGRACVQRYMGLLGGECRPHRVIEQVHRYQCNGNANEFAEGGCCDFTGGWERCWKRWLPRPVQPGKLQRC